MRQRCLFPLLLCLTAVATEDGLYGAESAVHTLTDKDIPGPHDARFLLVEYYSAWCGHCQRFAPEYEILATRARTELPSLRVGALNCPSYNDACAAASVASFPELILYPGKHVFKGDRNPSAILQWAASLAPGGPQLLNPEVPGGYHNPTANSSSVARNMSDLLERLVPSPVRALAQSNPPCPGYAGTRCTAALMR